MKAPMRAVAPTHNWAGWYAGLHIGGGVGENDSNFFRLSGNAPPHPTQYPESEPFVFGGGQIGYNWVVGQTLFGIEADISARSGNNLDMAEGPLTFNVNQDVGWFGTVRGRWGWLWAPQYLFYVTGGFAYGHTEFNALATGPSQGPFTFSGSSSKAGWTVGGGLEWAMDPRWSVKLEYQYVTLSDDGDTMFFCFTGGKNCNGNRGFFTASATDDMHTARLGLNYRFWGP